MSETYEILGLRYATHQERTRLDNFIHPDDHASPQPIDYFIWVIRNANRTILLDTGFDQIEANSRGRSIEIDPSEALSRIGIDSAKIETVIISHLHYDHAGTLDRFQAARFHVQETEVAYATGPCMCEDALRRAYNADHVCNFVRKIYSGRVEFYNGDGEIAPGVTVHHAGGHTRGLQCMRVATQTGNVVLASDATHLYENFERRKPFSITVDVEQSLRSYTKLEKLATSRAHIIPGHDPLVFERYPASKPQTQGFVHRLDVARLK